MAVHVAAAAPRGHSIGVCLAGSNGRNVVDVAAVLTVVPRSFGSKSAALLNMFSRSPCAKNSSDDT